MTPRHGTHAGYVKHIRDESTVCDLCRNAERLYQRVRRSKRPQSQDRYQWSRRKALQDLAENHRLEYDSLRAEYLERWDGGER